MLYESSGSFVTLPCDRSAPASSPQQLLDRTLVGTQCERILQGSFIYCLAEDGTLCCFSQDGVLLKTLDVSETERP